MKKIFLLDTNISSMPIHNALIDAGNQVFVVGGNPKDYLAKISENYINQDYSNLAEIEKLINFHNIDYVIPGCNDFSYEICAKLNFINNKIIIDKPDIVKKINNKKAFKEFATETGLPVPKLFTSKSQNLTWPLIVKPVDAYSGRGVTVLQKNEEELLDDAINAAKEFSKCGEIVIEEFVEGQLYSHSAFIKSKSIVVDFIVEEYGTTNPFAVDTSRVIYNFSRKMLLEIRQSINKLSSDLNLVDGLVHTQFIKKNNKFWIIEITRRCPGDLYSKLIELSTGFKYAEVYASFFFKGEVPLQTEHMQANHILRHTISKKNDGYFSNLKFDLEIKIEHLVILNTSGDWVKLSPFGRIGIVFISAQSEAALLTIFDSTLKRKLYTIN